MALFSFASWPEFVRDTLIADVGFYSLCALLRGQVGTASGHTPGICLHRKLKVLASVCVVAVQQFRCSALVSICIWNKIKVSPCGL